MDRRLVTWNVMFVRNLQDWEVEGEGEFLATLYKVKLQRGVEDVMVWAGNTRRKFTVKAMFRVLRGQGVLKFPAAQTWLSSIPCKIAFFN